MKNICVIAGDGIGQEVVPATVRLLEAAPLPLQFHFMEAGFACFEQYGSALPEATRHVAEECEAILFGATQSPFVKTPGYQSPILQLRQALDLYANLRPVRGRTRGGDPVDLLIVRENTEDLYVRRERRDGDTAIAERVITGRASKRIGMLACRLAAQRRGKLTVIHKSNVLVETDGLFRQSLFEVVEAWPQLDVNELLVDAAAMKLVMEPQSFDVLVAPNLYGDILSDCAAGLVGGLGLLPSSNLGDSHALFEPVHGSAPDIAGRGAANPTATLLAAAMMLRYLSYEDEAEQLEHAVYRALDGPIRTPDLGGTAATDRFCEAVLAQTGW